MRTWRKSRRHPRADRLPIVFLGGAALLCLVLLWSGLGPDAQPDPRPGPRLDPCLDAAADVDADADADGSTATATDPGRTVASEAPATATGAGIPLGDGTFLPPLNGVTAADGIPPIRRDPRLPPPGPILRKLIDGRGQEWWLHRDGSHTSCSFAEITLADGRRQRIVSTQHGAALPAAAVAPAGLRRGVLGPARSQNSILAGSTPAASRTDSDSLPRSSTPSTRTTTASPSLTPSPAVPR